MDKLISGLHNSVSNFGRIKLSVLSYIFSLFFYVAVAAGIRKISGAFDIGFIVSARYVFHLVIAGILAAWVSRKFFGSWKILFQPRDPYIQGIRSIAAFGGTVSFLFTGFFLPIGISNCLALAFRPLIILTFGLAPKFREEIHGKRWIFASLLTALCGVALMFVSRAGDGAVRGISLSVIIGGIVVIIINEAFTALGYHLNRAAARSGESKWTTLMFSSLFGVLVSLVFVGFGISIPVPVSSYSSTLDSSAAWMWLAVVVCLSIGAQLLQQIAAGKLPTAMLSFLAVLQPVIGGLFDFVFFGIFPDAVMFLAMALMVLSSILGMPALMRTKKYFKARADKEGFVVQVASDSR